MIRHEDIDDGSFFSKPHKVNSLHFYLSTVFNIVYISIFKFLNFSDLCIELSLNFSILHFLMLFTKMQITQTHKSFENETGLLLPFLVLCVQYFVPLLQSMCFKKEKSIRKKWI